MSGQSFLEMLQWHPRDVDTLERLYADRADEADRQAEDGRFARLQASVREQMGR